MRQDTYWAAWATMVGTLGAMPVVLAFPMDLLVAPWIHIHLAWLLLAGAATLTLSRTSLAPPSGLRSAARVLGVLDLAAAALVVFLLLHLDCLFAPSACPVGD